MLIDYVNPFVEATFEIMSEILGVPVKRGQLHLKKIGEEHHDVSVILGVTGNVSGRVIFDMAQSTALKLAGVLNEQEFSELDELAGSTLTEIGNMVTARAVTKLAQIDMVFNFSPPTLILGSHVTIFKIDESEALVIPIDTGYGMLYINIALR